ncbi:hypothetical protein JKP88DRAFT_273048 [Tribonema minus]|uniref:Uncharacterized protein n=1 Tax=Tribonema minus TaxID=303371 RepID=A0A835YX56_9STRA|nr:hypothetical protein JKP88DRAFT_273048 [Tribonema minus]
MLQPMNAGSAFGHRALAAAVVAAYALCVAASVVRHGDRSKTRHMTMRAVSLLRDAARSSIRADRDGIDAADEYAAAARARIYVAAVDRLLSAEDVAHLTGISIDRMREYVDEQLSRARGQLPREADPEPPAQQYSSKAPAQGAPRLPQAPAARREAWESASSSPPVPPP